MNRLNSELERLYFPGTPDAVEPAGPTQNLIDPSGRVRAMVMELHAPPDWDALSRVWHGVQVELALPAPAIAVSGIDGLQLWFSVAEPIAVASAHAFLEGLRQRFLSDTRPSRVRLQPAADASALRQDLHAARVPAQQPGSGNWSAFLAPDLVPVFAETPWLDIPPNEEGQASLLRSVEVTKLPAFEAACAMLGLVQPSQMPVVARAASGDEAQGIAREWPRPAIADGSDARQFLRQVMNDETVALALRIEAAKALLQHADDPRQPKRGG